MSQLICGMVLAVASCIYSDPHNHATGVPLVGTVSSTTNAVAVSVDTRPQTTAERATGAWDACLTSWTILNGWSLGDFVGFQLIFR